MTAENPPQPAEPIQPKQSTELLGGIVENMFRRHSAELVSALVRHFGAEHLELAEDVVQESLLRAMTHWSRAGVPENPTGWLFQTAKHLALDALRRQTHVRLEGDDRPSRSPQSDLIPDLMTTLNDFENPFEDDQLKMMFLCCHPSLSIESQITLTLRFLGGLGVKEIARAFLLPEETVSQRLFRAKAKLRELGGELGGELELPPEPALQARVDSVLTALYLMFNEGYSALTGKTLLNAALCEEALRLLEMLASHPVGDLPKSHALLALFYFQASRFNARVDESGVVRTLSEQDRKKWDNRLIALGFAQLAKAQQGDDLSAYHLQAAIASCHVRAQTFEQTDWKTMVQLYDTLVAVQDSPIFRLNRAVALGMQQGAAKGIEALTELESSRALKNYYPLYAALAEFYRKDGKADEAQRYVRQALALVANEPERKGLLRRLE